MASRVSFPILKEDISGNFTLDKNVDVNDITIKKNGVLMDPQPTIYNNGDGTYYFEISESAKYTALLNGIEQDELKDVYICSDDNLTDENIEETPAKGKIQKDGEGDLYVYTDGSSEILDESDVIDNLTSTDTDKPLSANQGKHLEDNKIEISDIIDNLTSTDTNKPLSAKQGKVLKDAQTLNFANEHFIDDTKTISQNIEKLDEAIYVSQGENGGGQLSYRTIYAPVLEADATKDSEIPSQLQFWVDGGISKIKVSTYFNKRTTDIRLRVRALVWTEDIDSYAQMSVIFNGVTYGGTLMNNESAEQDEIVIDFSAIENGLQKVDVKLSSTGSYDAYMKNVVIDVESIA